MTIRRIVVVGSGASGFALATRLGQAGHSVTLLEMGMVPAGAGAPARRVRDLTGAMPGSPTALGYRTDIRPDGRYLIGRGSTLGGSSAVNGGYFLRAHPSDFDTWARRCGTEWSYANCLPALRALESDADFADTGMHGVTGPVPVERPGADEITHRFIGAASDRLAAIIEADKNGGGPSGVGVLACNMRDGIRWGADLAYGPLARSVVDVVTGTRAERVLFSGSAAIGVEVTRDRERRVIEVDEVIIACGAIETPRLLRRSGIGAPADLTVPPVAELAAVGRGLSDHPAINLQWMPRTGVVDASSTVAWSAAWNTSPGELSAHPFELLNAVLPTAAIVTGTSMTEGPIDLRISVSAVGEDGSGVVDETGPDPLIRYGYLTVPEVQESLRTAVRAGIALLSSPEMNPVVEAVELIAALGSAPSDRELEAWIRKELVTSLHSVGTARMSDRPSNGVVDSHGRVFGTTGLRVADCSILPTVPSRGTSNTAFLIGERMAQLISDEDHADASTGASRPQPD